MNGVLGMATLLLGTELSDEQMDMVQSIRSSGDALLMVLSDILDLSRIESGKLELERHPFDLAECLEARLRALDRRSYDVVLMDMQMPEMGGLEATRRIGERYGASRRPWIVAVTASAMKGDRERFLAAGADDYIAKPIGMDELLKVLERVPVSD